MTSYTHHPADVTAVVSSLRSIAAAVVRAGHGGNLQNVLQEIAHVARRLANARYAALGIPDGGGGLRHFIVSGLTDEEVARIPHPPVGRGLLGVIMNERKSLRISNLHQDARSAGFPPHHPHMKSLLGVPIQLGSYLFGSLYLSDRLDDTPFTEADQFMVETLAGYAALAIAGVELSERQTRVSLLEERERISMELHDSVIQSLYAIGMELQLLRAEISQPDLLDSPITHLDSVIAEIRQYILNLKSAVAHQQTVRQSIVARLERLHIPPSLRIEISAPENYPPFDAPTFDSICQICTEAASNAIRHAQATELSVTIAEQERLFIMTIADNGTGFNTAESPKGLGLTNIERRAERLGGRIEVRSSEGKGTQVILTVPIR
jgi:signal transduction histidine kinase